MTSLPRTKVLMSYFTKAQLEALTCIFTKAAVYSVYPLYSCIFYIRVGALGGTAECFPTPLQRAVL